MPVAVDWLDDIVWEAEDAVFGGARDHGDPSANRYDFGIDTAVAFLDDLMEIIVEAQGGLEPNEGVIDEVIGGVRLAAQDYNGTRSNRSAGIVLNKYTGDLLDEALALALAQDYNGTRSNRSAGIVAKYADPLADAVATNTRAQDYNSSRSNTTTAVADFVDDVYALTSLAVFFESNPGRQRLNKPHRVERMQKLVDTWFVKMAEIAKLDEGKDEAVHTYNFLMELGQGAVRSAAKRSHNASRSNQSGGIVAAFTEAVFGEIISVVAAQDYNSSRSNNSSAVLNDYIDKLLRATLRAQDYNGTRGNRSAGLVMRSEVIDVLGDVGAIAQAQDYNGTRSNRSAGIVSNADSIDLGDGALALAPAKDYNGTHSNRSAGIRAVSSDFFGGLRGALSSQTASRSHRATGDYYRKLVETYAIDSVDLVSNSGTYAQDYNSSRSNNSSIVIDIEFNPGNALEQALNVR